MAVKKRDGDPRSADRIPDSVTKTMLDDMLKELPDALQEELRDLKKNDDKIMEALKDEEMAKLFFIDPGQALERMGIAISPQLRSLLEKNKLSPDVLKMRTHRLPNGQKVNTSFTIEFKSRGH